MVEDIISSFSEKQKHVWCLCPRCGCDSMNKDAARNALSRRADIMICNICGNVEAVEDMVGQKLSLDKWKLIEHPERYFLKGKDYFNFYFTFGSWEGFPFQNAYIVVEGFDRADAVKRFRRKFPDKTEGIACYSFDYSETAWAKTSLSVAGRFKETAKVCPCAGVLHLDDQFEEAE